MRAPTSGWIGIGFSENGNMINADMHVGWVKNGEAVITVRRLLCLFIFYDVFLSVLPFSCYPYRSFQVTAKTKNSLEIS